MSQVAALSLAAVLDLNAAAPLHSEIRARAGAPLDLDGAAVERLGGLCAQVLICAAIAWRNAGQAMRIVNASPALRDDVRLLGATDLIAIAAEN